MDAKRDQTKMAHPKTPFHFSKHLSTFRTTKTRKSFLKRLGGCRGEKGVKGVSFWGGFVSKKWRLTFEETSVLQIVL